MSGLFGSTTIPGNRLTDIATQTSTVGIPLPFGYGRFPVDGNIIWTAGKPTEHVTKKSQGKGGVKTQEFTYTLSYAIAFCAGPIYGYFTILRQGKVVFTTDPNAAIEDKEFAAKWAEKCTMYFGTRTQMPDSTIEAKEGAGRVSAFRDLAYIVLEDDDVTDNGGAIPQYSAIVIASPPEVYVTSKPYPLEVADNVLAGKMISADGKDFYLPFELVNAGQVTAHDGELREIINTLELPPTDFVQAGSVSAYDGTLKEVKITLTMPPTDFVDAGEIVAYDGTQKETLKQYLNWPMEYIAAGSITPLDGTLT